MLVLAPTRINIVRISNGMNFVSILPSICYYMVLKQSLTLNSVKDFVIKDLVPSRMAWGSSRMVSVSSSMFVITSKRPDFALFLSWKVFEYDQNSSQFT